VVCRNKGGEGKREGARKEGTAELEEGREVKEG